MTDDARKVLDEVWDVREYADGSGPAVYVEEYYGMGALVGRSHSSAKHVLTRARIAACAPEALRLLLELEWEETDGFGERCHVCCAELREDHKPDCRLVALLVKAGLR